MSDSNNTIYLYNTASSWEQVSNVGCCLLADALGNCSAVLYTPSPTLFGVKALLGGGPIPIFPLLPLGFGRTPGLIMRSLAPLPLQALQVYCYLPMSYYPSGLWLHELHFAWTSRTAFSRGPLPHLSFIACSLHNS